MNPVLLSKMSESATGPDLLIDLIRSLRPAHRLSENTAPKKLELLLTELEENETLRQSLRNYLVGLFTTCNFRFSLTETGIQGENGLFAELWKRIAHKILPNQPAPDTIDYVLTNALYRSWDHRWITHIPDQLWVKLFRVLDIAPFATTEHSLDQLLFSVRILAQRICGTAMQADFLRMVPEYDSLDSPFLFLQKEVDAFTSQLHTDKDELLHDEQYRHIKILISQCHDLLNSAINNREKFGISFATTSRILRVRQQLDRLSLVLGFIMHHGNDSLQAVHFFKEIVRIHATKNRIGRFFRQTSHLVAYQVTQHTGKTGEHYITSSRKEYMTMFRSAAGAGVVVGFLCLFKLLLSHVHTSPFGHAFLYSMNYAFGFILIYFLHFTLATKQPAMTAATMAKVLADKNHQDGHFDQFAELFSRLFRSQFIAFVGNVFLSFPVALLIIHVWQLLTGSLPLDHAKSMKMLHEADPVHSLAIFHASIAGVYLFFSGLISGYFINMNVHRQISLRMRNHPGLKTVVPEKVRDRFARFYDKHIGGVSGNFWFGVFLGSTATLGAFFGLPLDIRHITFVAGNFGIALVGLGYDVTTEQVLLAVLGIGLVGFFNFLVSFSLSLFIAMRSRQLGISDLAGMMGAIWQRFLYLPRDFFLPPQKPVKNGVDMTL